MAIFPTKIHDEYNASNHMEFVMDQDSDVALLPGLDTCAPGSKATSIASGNVFYLTTFGFWTKSTKALVTEELRVDKPGTYAADEGKAFNPVIVADVGNPNYVETIEGTLANLLQTSDHTISELATEINGGNATVLLDIDGSQAGFPGVFKFSLLPSMGGGLNYIGGSLNAFGNSISDTIAVSVDFKTPNSLYYFEVLSEGTISNLTSAGDQFPTTLTIIHHPLPDSGT